MDSIHDIKGVVRSSFITRYLPYFFGESHLLYRCCYEHLSADLNVKPVDSKNVAAAIFLLEVEADEMWSFVGNKDAARELWQKSLKRINNILIFMTLIWVLFPKKISTQSIRTCCFWAFLSPNWKAT